MLGRGVFRNGQSIHTRRGLGNEDTSILLERCITPPVGVYEYL